MSMRVDNGSLAGVGGSGPFDSTRSLGGSRSYLADGDESSADSVKLSGASELVAIARNVTSVDRDSRIAALTSQVRSGAYGANSLDVSRALVQQSF